jgi:hypothetical protein
VIAYGPRERQRVFDDDRVRAYECVAAHPAKLVDARVRAERGKVVDCDMACERSPVRKYDMTAYAAVVRDVRLRHKQVIRADPGEAAAALRPSMQGGELAERVALAGPEPGPLAFVFKVGRGLTRRHERVKDRAAAELGRPLYHAMARHADPVVQYYVVAYD